MEPILDLQQDDRDSADATASFLESYSELLSQPLPEAEPPPVVEIDRKIPDSNEHWQPMLALFGSGIASQFLWAVTTGVIETYEHRETLRYLHIDSVTGECLNQSCEVISSESALHHAFQSRTLPVAHATEATTPTHARASAFEEGSSTAESTEPLLNSFLRTSEERPNDMDDVSPETAAPLSSATHGSVLENLHNLLQPAIRLRLKNLLRAKSSPSRKAQSTTTDPLPSELNLASFTRRHTAR